MRWPIVASLLALTALSAPASPPTPLPQPTHDGDNCVATGSVVRTAIADGELHVQPRVRTFLLDIADGKQVSVAEDVRHMRAQFNARQLQDWLDTGLFHATYFNRAFIARRLIAEGANVNARTAKLATAGSPEATDADKMWPPIEQAADCGNTAVLKVLLDRGANLYASLDAPTPMPGALLLAIMGKHEDTVTLLLDHGYDPCLLYANYYPRRNRTAAADVASRAALSPQLTRRLATLTRNCGAKVAPASTAD